MDNLANMTVFQLPWAAFYGLFCKRCRRFGTSEKQWTEMMVCRGLVDNGEWYRNYEEAR